MDLSRVVLVCPRNDAESVLIHLLAVELGMQVITSTQGVGATLEAEPILERLILLSPARDVWIVEIPGPETENRLKEAGMVVTTIDHHTYGPLDRSRDSNGLRLPSSLEQFLKLADENGFFLDMAGFWPRSARGLGIFDDRYAQGLRDDGYILEEIQDVLALREELLRLIDPGLDARLAAARAAWEQRKMREEYTVVQATGPEEVRGEVGILTIADGCDTHPLVIIEHEGRATFVQNVEPSIIRKLQAHFDHGVYNTFTFGGGRCWGTDSTKKGEWLDPKRILTVLGI